MKQLIPLCSCAGRDGIHVQDCSRQSTSAAAPHIGSACLFNGQNANGNIRKLKKHRCQNKLIWNIAMVWYYQYGLILIELWFYFDISIFQIFFMDICIMAVRSAIIIRDQISWSCFSYGTYNDNFFLMVMRCWRVIHGDIQLWEVRDFIARSGIFTSLLNEHVRHKGRSNVWADL